MGWEPITYCRECGEAFDVYRAPEERICECCAEFLAERESRALYWVEEMEKDNEPTSTNL